MLMTFLLILSSFSSSCWWLACDDSVNVLKWSWTSTLFSVKTLFLPQLEGAHRSLEAAARREAHAPPRFYYRKVHQRLISVECHLHRSHACRGLQHRLGGQLL